MVSILREARRRGELPRYSEKPRGLGAPRYREHKPGAAEGGQVVFGERIRYRICLCAQLNGPRWKPGEEERG